MTKAEVLHFAILIAEAMEAIHAEGVGHCDVKPENVMILPDRTIKMVDFGRACEIPENGLKDLVFGTFECARILLQATDSNDV